MGERAKKLGENHEVWANQTILLVRISSSSPNPMLKTVNKKRKRLNESGVFVSIILLLK